MSIPNISVCICTFKRAELLRGLLDQLESQRTDGLFSFDVVIADNDGARSAESTVQAFAARSSLRVTYCVEPEPNIARARNAAIANSTGALIAFIDDDELPTREWLYWLFQALIRYHTAGVLGPVMAHFQQEPPSWVSKGRFFDRPRHQTGRPIHWTEARTGNVLLTRKALTDVSPSFRLEFATAGEDVDFFRRATANGSRFVWCDEAVVFELVPPQRCTRRHLLRRALLRGSNFPKHPMHRGRNALKSLIAVPCYTLAMPLLALAGHHRFMKYLIKLLDHTSRLLAYAGVPLVAERDS